MPFTHFDDLDLLAFTNELKISFINFFLGYGEGTAASVYPHARLIFFFDADDTIFFQDPTDGCPIHKGDWLLVPPFVRIRHTLNQSAPHLSLHFTFQAYEGFDLLSQSSRIICRHDPERVHEVERALSAKTKMDLALLFQEVCFACLREVKDAFPAFSRIAGLYRDPETIRLIRLITQNVRPDFTLRDLAEHSRLSINVIVKKMTRVAGMPPGRFMDRILTRRAAQLLMKESLSVKETAYRCGFRDPYGFSRFFRRMTGTSPSEFQRRFQGQHGHWSVLELFPE